METLMASSGLVFITNQSFSGVSSVSIDNCFSATYYNYLIKGTVSSDVAGESTTSLAGRWRAGGSDASGTDYYRAQVYADLTTPSCDFANTTSIGNIIGDNRTGLWGYFNVWVHNPYRTVWTTYSQDYNSYTTSTLSLRFTSGVHRQAVAYDGFTVFPGSGTITGNLGVWGLVKA